MAFIKVVNTDTVDGILADFQNKIAQLSDLALKRQAAIADRSDRIKVLAQQNEEDQQEADRALAAANKIQSFFN